MKQWRFFLLINLLLGSSIITQARNWHPFPFRITYYSRPASIEGKYHGNVVEAIYLDQDSSNNRRCRSSQYPTFNYGFHTPVDLLVREVFTTTQADSAIVQWLIYGQNQGYSNTMQLSNRNPGTEVWPGGVIQSRTMTTIFGVVDSMCTILYNNQIFRWTRNFGLLDVPVYNYSEITGIHLIGVKDLQLGWSDITIPPSIPSVGDEYHIEILSSSSVGCDPPPPGGNHPYSDFRSKMVKVINYPYQGDSSTAKFQMTELTSDSTGVLTEVVNSIYPDWGPYYTLPVSTSPPNAQILQDPIYGVWIDSSGMTIPYKINEFIDGPPTVYFLPCSFMRLHTYYNQFISYYVLGAYCSGTVISLEYPRYIKTVSGCSMGQPFAPVLITDASERKSSVHSALLYPQPATNSFVIQPAENRDDQVELVNFHGKIIRTWERAEGTKSLAGIPAGIYILRIGSQNVLRLVKE